MQYDIAAYSEFGFQLLQCLGQLTFRFRHLSVENGERQKLHAVSFCLRRFRCNVEVFFFLRCEQRKNRIDAGILLSEQPCLIHGTIATTKE